MGPVPWDAGPAGFRADIRACSYLDLGGSLDHGLGFRLRHGDLVRGRGKGGSVDEFERPPTL